MRHKPRPLSPEDAQILLETLLDHVPDMVFVKDAANLRFVEFNRAGEELLGYSREQLLGRSDHDFFPPNEADFFVGKDRKVLESRIIEEIPEENVHGKGGTRVLHTKKIPVFGRRNQPLFLLGISKDITAQKRAEAERDLSRDEVERMKVERELRTQFVRALSHDLRSPLTSARMAIETLASKNISDPILRDRLLNSTLSSITRMSSMVQNLLDANAIEAGKAVPLRLVDFSLSDHLTHLVGDLNHLANGRVQLEIPAPLRVRWDPEAIQRVIENLVSNALKYGAHGTPVRISVSIHDDRIRLSVHNEGSHLSPEDQKKLFVPFSRLACATEQKKAGWGIGLTIVRGIAEAHGGSIYVESAPERGTAFVLNLPINSTAP